MRITTEGFGLLIEADNPLETALLSILYANGCKVELASPTNKHSHRMNRMSVAIRPNGGWVNEEQKEWVLERDALESLKRR